MVLVQFFGLVGELYRVLVQFLASWGDVEGFWQFFRPTGRALQDFSSVFGFMAELYKVLVQFLTTLESCRGF